MTRKEILRILDWPESGVDWSDSGLLARIMRVAKAAAAAEREACAKVCEDRALRMEREAADIDADDAVSLRSSAWLISVCAAAIRARSKT